MPVSEIKAGMVGVGRTVFEGSDLQEFKAHILGVLRNVQGPHRDLILARLEGGPLAKTGVAAGHERQPGLHRWPADWSSLVLDWSFATEAIAGITPIAEMTDATETWRVACHTTGSHRSADHA